MRRTDTTLSISYDLFFRRNAYLLQHGSQLVGGPYCLVRPVREEVEPFQVDSARDMTGPAIPSGVRAIPFAVRSKV